MLTRATARLFPGTGLPAFREEDTSRHQGILGTGVPPREGGRSYRGENSGALGRGFSNLSSGPQGANILINDSGEVKLGEYGSQGAQGAGR